MRVRRALALSEQFQDKCFSPILLPFPSLFFGPTISTRSSSCSPFIPSFSMLGLPIEILPDGFAYRSTIHNELVNWWIEEIRAKDWNLPFIQLIPLLIGEKWQLINRCLPGCGREAQAKEGSPYL